MDMERSLAWLDKYGVDQGARGVFLLLDPAQQEEIRRPGGLGKVNPSAMLMKRIHEKYGHVPEARMQPHTPESGAEEPDEEGRNKKVFLIPADKTRGSGRSQSSNATSSNATPDFKGGGKGSLGDPLEEPVASRRRPRTGEDGCHCGRGAKPENIVYPEPKKYTAEEIEGFMTDPYHYTEPEEKFWSGTDHREIVPGDHVLWRSGAKTGKRGGPSTKIEYFHGIVDGWDGDRIVMH